MIDKLIIFGSNGMLGRYLKKYFSRENIELILVTRNEYEITSDNLSYLEDFLVGQSINDNTCIVNCTGLIPQRVNKKDNANYYIVNSIFPLHLSKICDKYKTKIICSTTNPSPSNLSILLSILLSTFNGSKKFVLTHSSIAYSQRSICLMYP